MLLLKWFYVKCNLTLPVLFFFQGGTRDIGSALTRMCMRHRSIEAKLKHFSMWGYFYYLTSWHIMHLICCFTTFYGIFLCARKSSLLDKHLDGLRFIIPCISWIFIIYYFDPSPQRPGQTNVSYVNCGLTIFPMSWRSVCACTSGKRPLYRNARKETICLAQCFRPTLARQGAL